MAEKNAPFRADHVGSLLRPPELLRAREQYQQGTLSAESLREIEDSSIRDVAKLQEAQRKFAEANGLRLGPKQ